MTVLFDKDTAVDDVRKLLDCAAPYDIRLDVDSGMLNSTMSGLPEADIDLPDNRLAADLELDDGAMAAELNALSEGQLRFEDGQSLNEEVFEMETKAPSLEHGDVADSIAEEPKLTQDAAITILDSFLIDAPEAFETRGDVSLVPSNATLERVQFSAPPMTGDLDERVPGVNDLGDVAIGGDDAPVVQANVELLNMTTGYVATVPPRRRKPAVGLEVDVDIQAHDVANSKTGQPDIDGPPAGGVKLRTGTEDNDKIKSTLNKFGVVDADLTHAELARQDGGGEAKIGVTVTARDNGDHLKSALVDVSAGWSAENLNITDEPVDGQTVEIAPIIASSLTPESVVGLHEGPLDADIHVDAIEEPSSVQVVDVGEVEIAVPEVSVDIASSQSNLVGLLSPAPISTDADLGVTLSAEVRPEPEVLHVDSLQAGILQLAQAESGAAAPTIEVHNTTGGEGVGAKVKADAPKVDAAKRKSGLLSNIFHKKDKKKKPAPVGHADLSVPHGSVADVKAHGDIMVTTGVPTIEVSAPHAQPNGVATSSTDVIAPVILNDPSVITSANLSEVDVSVSKRETGSGAEVEIISPKADVPRMKFDGATGADVAQDSAGIEPIGVLFMPEAEEVGKSSIGLNAAVPDEILVGLQTANSTNPDLASSLSVEPLHVPVAAATAELSPLGDDVEASVVVDAVPVVPSMPGVKLSMAREPDVELPSADEHSFTSSETGPVTGKLGLDVATTNEQPAVSFAASAASPVQSPTSAKEEKKSGGKLHNWNPFKSKSSKKTDKSAGVKIDADVGVHRPESIGGAVSPGAGLSGGIQLHSPELSLGVSESDRNPGIAVDATIPSLEVGSHGSIVGDKPEVVGGDIPSSVDLTPQLKMDVVAGESGASVESPAVDGDTEACGVTVNGGHERSKFGASVSVEAGEPEHPQVRPSMSEPAAVAVKSSKKGGGFGGIKNMFKPKTSKKSESDHQRGSKVNHLVDVNATGPSMHVGAAKQVNLDAAAVGRPSTVHIGAEASAKVDVDVPEKLSNPEIAAALGLPVSVDADVAVDESRDSSQEPVVVEPGSRDVGAADEHVPLAERDASDGGEGDYSEVQRVPSLEVGLDGTHAANAVDSEPGATGSEDDDNDDGGGGSGGGDKTASDDDSDADIDEETPKHAAPEVSPQSGEFEFSHSFSEMDLDAHIIFETVGLRPMATEIAEELNDIADDYEDQLPTVTDDGNAHMVKSSSSPSALRLADRDNDVNAPATSPDDRHRLPTIGHLERASATIDLSMIDSLPTNSYDQPSPPHSSSSDSEDEDSSEGNGPPRSPPPPPPSDEPLTSESTVQLANGRKHSVDSQHDEGDDDDDEEENDDGKSQRHEISVSRSEERQPVTKRMAPKASDLNNNNEAGIQPSKA